MAQYVSDIGGGALTELGTYPVFLSTLFLGKPTYIQASGSNTDNGEEEFFSAFLSYAHGQYSLMEASLISKRDSEIIIKCDKGTVKIKNPWNEKPEGIEVDLSDGTKVVHKSEWEGTGLHFELDEVYNCIKKGVIESPMYCHKFCLDVRKTMDKIHAQLI
jgi:predicted dehydrogenase